MVRLGMMKREKNMMKFKIEDMKVFSDESFEERFGFEVSEEPFDRTYRRMSNLLSLIHI